MPFLYETEDFMERWKQQISYKIAKFLPSSSRRI